MSHSKQGGSEYEVLRTLEDRRAGRTTEGVKLGLVLEGGSLRGVFGSGACQALCDYGMHQAFDVIVGNSSGGLNGTYLPGCNQETGLIIYRDHATSKNCINFWKFPNVLDVEWLVRTWILNRLKYDETAVFKGRAEVFLPVTDTRDGTTHWFSTKRSTRQEFEEALVATSCTPLVCDQTVKIGNGSFNDGLLGAAIPIEKAIEEGCTHIVVIMTTQTNAFKSRGNLIKRMFSWLRTKKFGKDYQRKFLNKHENYNRQKKICLNGYPGVKILNVAPSSDSDLVGNIQVDQNQIERSWERGRSIMSDVLEIRRS